MATDSIHFSIDPFDKEKYEEALRSMNMVASFNQVLKDLHDAKFVNERGETWRPYIFGELAMVGDYEGEIYCYTLEELVEHFEKQYPKQQVE